MFVPCKQMSSTKLVKPKNITSGCLVHIIKLEKEQFRKMPKECYIYHTKGVWAFSGSPNVLFQCKCHRHDLYQQRNSLPQMLITQYKRRWEICIRNRGVSLWDRRYATCRKTAYLICNEINKLLQ